MQLQYGSYVHAVNEAAIVVQKSPLLNEAGLMYGARETWTVTGFLQAANQNAITAACNALEVAYSTNYLRLTLLANDDSVARTLAGRTRLGGTRVIGGVSFPESGEHSGEWSTYRAYSITVEGTYPLPGVSPFVLLSWMELLDFSGGGPRFVHLQPLVGVPQRQQTAFATPFKARQEGRAVGMYGYPVPSPPLWPFDEHIDQRQVKRETPKRAGDQVGSVYTEWPVSWSYSFESAVPMFANPTLWRG